MAENADGDLNSNLLHAPYLTGDPQLDTAIEQWLRWDKVGTWTPGHPSPSSCPPSHNPPFPVPTQGFAGARGDGTGHRRASGVGRCLSPMQGLPAPSGGAGWAGQRHLQQLSFAIGYTPTHSRHPLPSGVYHLSFSKYFIRMILIILSCTPHIPHPFPFPFLP